MKQNARILIVDDFPMIRSLLKRCLISLGYAQIDEASDGQQAWNMIVAGSYDLVFLDWNMPGVTGIEVVEKCKSTPAYANIAIIMISAERERGNVIRAMKAGANDYILKPFSAALISEKIEKHLNKVSNPSKAVNG